MSTPFIRALTLVCLLLAGAMLPASQVRANDSEVRERLDRAREISYTRHWEEAQAILDELKPRLDEFDQAEFVDFHLLEARHLTLANRSREALERAAMLLDKPLDERLRLRTLQFSANVAVLLRDYETAFDHLLDALAIEPDVDDPAATIATYNMASYMFGKVGEHERAIEYGELAIERALEHGDANAECVARQRVAPVYKWAGRHERSEAEYRRAIEVCQEIGNELFAGVVQHGLADLLRRNGRAEEAVELARQAVANLAEAVYPLGENEARLVLAESLFDLGQLDESFEPRLAELSDYLHENELWDQLMRLEALQARRAVVAGDAAAALKHMRREEQARENFLGRDRMMRLAYLEVQFDTRLKEQRIELLAERERAARLEADTATQQRRARTVILVLSGFIVVLLLVLLSMAVRGRRHFRHLSRHDALSGLPNQRWFFERAEEALERADREGKRIFMLMADIDHFKRINDTHGHLVGDDVLGQTARRLQQAFGEEALVGRLGGEEFGVLVEDRSLEEVIAGIESFRAAAPGTVRQGDPAVTVSFGVARRDGQEGLESLRRKADQAMYRAKSEGRDRYVVGDD